MYDLYLVTGATGNLGRAVIRQLLAGGRPVRALVLPGDPLEKLLPAGAEKAVGSVTDRRSMDLFFSGDLHNACLIHCAGIVSIASEAKPSLWSVNVGGTRNILQLCLERGVGRVVYISTVHAIPEAPEGVAIREVSSFSPETVKGDYAKSKAEASAIVLAAVKKGLNASIVHPSGIIGPDESKGNISAVVLSCYRGKLPLAVQGGYDFVDVRDVAAGILSCAENGRKGECYILSGQYATVKDILGFICESCGIRKPAYLPLWLVKLVAPVFEAVSVMQDRESILTAYSAYTLGSNACFSRVKAERELGYAPRPLTETLSDMLQNIRRGTMV